MGEDGNTGYGDSGPAGSSGYGDPAGSTMGAEYGGDGGFGADLSGFFAPTNYATASGVPGFDFGDMGFGDYGGVGFGDYGDMGGYSLGSMYADPTDTSITNFTKSPFAQVMMGLLSTNPTGAKVATGAKALNDPVSAALGTLPGPIGAIGNLGYSTAKATDQGKAFGGGWGSLAGGLVGTAVAGPVGGLVGSYAGNQLGNAMSGLGVAGVGSEPGQQDPYNFNTQPMEFNEPKTTGMGWRDLATGLGGIYGNYQAAKQAGANSGALSGQINNLSSMYGPNSAYAAQLRQTLARKDAAAGRNSQYGPREAQLQALLADKAASTASTVGNLAAQSNTANLAKQKAQAQLLNTGLGFLDRSGAGKAIGNYATQGADYLSSLFG